jgi:hypothetical protein
MYLSKTSKKETEQTNLKPHIEKHRNLPYTYWVQSFNPKKSQLSYMVILSDDKVHCSCEAFKYQGTKQDTVRRTFEMLIFDNVGLGHKHYRSKPDIIAELLTTAQELKGKTKLMYIAMISSIS